MITLYGIPNCDTVKKARNWLKQNHIDYHFHNFKKDQLDPDILDKWIEQLGWEVLLNKRGMTWRKLAPEIKQDIDQEKAAAIMLDNLSIIKRPVLDYKGQLQVGFKADEYSGLLLK